MRTRLMLLLVGILWPVGSFAQTPEVVEYYHPDALGSVRVVTTVVNGQVQVVSRHDFLPFGEELQPTWPPPDKRLFTGKERDFATALDYFGARYTGTGLGRFTTVDPMMSSSESVADPQRWNRYAYARSNPLTFLDPDGRFWVWAAGIKAKDQRFIELAVALAILNPDIRAEFDRVANSERPVIVAAGKLKDPSSTVHVTGQTSPGLLVPRLYPTIMTFDVADIRHNHPEDKSGTWTFVHELQHVVDNLFCSIDCFYAGHFNAMKGMDRVDHSTEEEMNTLAELRAIEDDYLAFLLDAALAYVRSMIGRPVLPSKPIPGLPPDLPSPSIPGHTVGAA